MLTITESNQLPTKRIKLGPNKSGTSREYSIGEPSKLSEAEEYKQKFDKIISGICKNKLISEVQDLKVPEIKFDGSDLIEGRKLFIFLSDMSKKLKSEEQSQKIILEILAKKENLVIWDIWIKRFFFFLSDLITNIYSSTETLKELSLGLNFYLNTRDKKIESFYNEEKDGSINDANIILKDLDLKDYLIKRTS